MTVKRDWVYFGGLVGGAALIGWFSPNLWLTLGLAVLWWFVWVWVLDFIRRD